MNKIHYLMNREVNYTLSKCFLTRLTGREEVPLVKTDACGLVLFRFNTGFTGLRFKLVLNDIEILTAVHIHLGTRGENGQVVAFLFGPVTRGISVNRGVVTGIIVESDLTGPLQGMSLLELARKMEIDNSYVNAHTENHPNGEIRGQIKRF
ncbi:CHRD domain-containing protein [Bacillus pseudomycoides]|uniref:CHRD domain-containing protein n=1 Tax=Bacillus pseudomycoides TaxID=64104 RepID=UPI000BEE61BF|nr:CHRD domain-containing protein [Bacillus pseudomycoides]PEE06807.1 CHRD domain-containing protein [Bacillus pseudomycoides]PEM65710.1 CHRD domain-containing protein [Bacillus pseudomycoides]PHC86807.1 CHRD domain-containing protein [Bacillus pseudomycoides]